VDQGQFPNSKTLWSEELCGK